MASLKDIKDCQERIEHIDSMTSYIPSPILQIADWQTLTYAYIKLKAVVQEVITHGDDDHPCEHISNDQCYQYCKELISKSL